MEIWKPIQNYEKFYEISNYGRIKTKERIVRNNNGFMTRKPRILKPVLNSKGYCRIMLTDEHKNKKRYFVHRLVAQHFLKPVDGANVVNHKDFNIKNNKVENLEWTTFKENMQYSFKRGRFDKAIKNFKARLKIQNEKLKKSVIGISLKSGEKIKFHFLNDVKKAGFQPSCVCDVCKGKRKTHLGYVWMYAE